jgi:hypothetical protein
MENDRKDAQRSSRDNQPDKKKSYRRSWRSASPLRKLEIIALGIGAAVGFGYLGVTVWGNLETKWNFQADQRPHIAPVSYSISIR